MWIMSHRPRPRIGNVARKRVVVRFIRAGSEATRCAGGSVAASACRQILLRPVPSCMQGHRGQTRHGTDKASMDQVGSNNSCRGTIGCAAGRFNSPPTDRQIEVRLHAEAAGCRRRFIPSRSRFAVGKPVFSHSCRTNRSSPLISPISPADSDWRASRFDRGGRRSNPGRSGDGVDLFEIEVQAV